MVAQPGDPMGEVEVNLGKTSLLYDVDPTLFRGVFDEREDTVASHTGDQQQYTFSKSFYSSDVYISIPKLKTHQKVGATLNLKGLVGLITNKNQLVHWRVGYPEVGGDEYPDRRSYEEGQHAKVTHRGAWPGNDTIWRMVVDLYQAFLTKTGRKYFTVIDGILAGEGQGPFCPNAKYATTLLAGNDLFTADIVAVRYMGLDPQKIKYLAYFIDKWGLNLDRDISIVKDGVKLSNFFSSSELYKDFRVIDCWNEIKVRQK